MSDGERVGGSFRDPSGFLYRLDGCLYRQVNRVYASHYDRLMGSGLYADLTGRGLLVEHAEVPAAADAYRTLRPEPLPFISYPYEWCFSELQDAALATLEIQSLALARGMTLKDASAYNLQFRDGKPLLIDTLSFEVYEPGRPWVAYRQFCQHFLAPLALCSYCDVRLGQLLRTHLDGLPLDLAARLLPFRSRLNLGLKVHLHLHARAQRAHADRAPGAPRDFSLAALHGVIESLKATVRGLRWRPARTGWAAYYEDTNYSPAAFAAKQRIVDGFLGETPAGQVWDLGGNVGLFSRLAAARGLDTVSFDLDPLAVELNYQEVRRAGQVRLLPLVMDLTNPSPALGWAHGERLSLAARGPARTALALALIHHLAIGNNVPLPDLASYFAQLCEYLVIEFVPKDDSQVQRLLRSREDVFPRYTQEAFEASFGERFQTLRTTAVPESRRTLYLMRRGPG